MIVLRRFVAKRTPGMAYGVYQLQIRRHTIIMIDTPLVLQAVHRSPHRYWLARPERADMPVQLGLYVNFHQVILLRPLSLWFSLRASRLSSFSTVSHLLSPLHIIL